MILGMKPYSAYKESGIPWLGRVPEHWRLVRNKLFLREINERSPSGSEELLTVSQYTGVTKRRDRASEDGELLTNAESLIGYKQVEAGQLVINIMLAWNGSLGVSPIPGIVSPAYCVFAPGRDIEPRFLHYLFRTPLFTGVFKTASTGVVDSRLRLYPDAFLRLYSLLPPTEEEQAAIVRFLDYADRRIRSYIRVKQQLIKRLEEQKQAIVHRFVVGNSEAIHQYKKVDSQWFPEIPEHWEVLPMRRVISHAIDGPHFSPDYLDAGIPFLSARNIKVDQWSLEDAKYISEADYVEFCKRVIPERGDVLYTKGGTTGVARPVDLEFRFQVWVHVAVLKVRKVKIRPEFLSLVLNSPRCYEQAQLLTRGATNQDLGLNRMKDIVLPLPPLAEQDEILRSVASATRQITESIKRARKSIELLCEYRKVLITDVVTGKEDVQDVAKALPVQIEESLHARIQDEVEYESPDETGAELENTTEEAEA